ncbi:MAG: BamA/TamA family outer membrane protein [Gemmatimonadota bacterium]
MRIRWLWVGLGIVAVSARLQGQLPIDTRVLPREVADEVLHVWNAPATLRVAGPYLVEASREVEGDIGVSGGSLTVSGHVTGRIVAINATVRLTSGARVDGEILVVGGTVDGRDLATIGGQIRVYRARLDVARVGDRFELPPDDESGRWWQRNERWRDRGWSSLRLVSAHTYNRVEGLPVIFGPNFGRDLGWGRLSGEASGIWRTSQGFKWNSDVVGHSVKAELQFGVRRGVRLGGRQLDLVEPVESWQLSDEEVGLASVLLHRDFRDYFNRHGGTVYASLFRGAAFDATLGYSDQRWADRRTRDPWTLFRNSETWRENPVLDEGNFHLLNGTLRYDTRNDEGNPWSGWYILGDYEYGTGAISRYGTASPGARTETIDGLTTYDRLFVDVRRYNRIAPGAQLNMRLAAGGWLSGDDLPLQRRFSLGGPGTMPGFDFRRTAGEPDVFQCSTSTLPGSGFPPGRPAQCERFALAQVEYRGDMHFDLFGVLDEERDRRRAGWGRGTEWVVFADAGRGWLVGAPDGGLSYPQGSLPALSTFRADIGLGIVLDNVGVYLAKSLSNGSEPINIFVRLRPRF